VFANAEVFVRRSGLTVRFTDDEHVELLGDPRENGTERRDVLRESDNVTSRLVLATSADPHDEARRSEAAEHLFHLGNAVQDELKIVRDESGVSVVLGAVAVAREL
jgi:hypothetical protein